MLTILLGVAAGLAALFVLCIIRSVFMRHKCIPGFGRNPICARLWAALARTRAKQDAPAAAPPLPISMVFAASPNRVTFTWDQDVELGDNSDGDLQVVGNNFLWENNASPSASGNQSVHPIDNLEFNFTTPRIVLMEANMVKSAATGIGNELLEDHPL